MRRQPIRVHTKKNGSAGLVGFAFLGLSLVFVCVAGKLIAGPEDLATWEGYPSAARIQQRQISSPYAILYDCTDNEILFSESADEQAYPASLTKIMTTIVALENIRDLHGKATIQPEVCENLRKANASVAGFLPNETVTVQDLLYGTMLPSGADAAITLAQVIAGSEKQFVDMMNQKAQELGMRNTVFQNCTGLHQQGHVSTARDMMKLLQYAWEQKTFRKIFTAQTYTVRSTQKHPSGLTISSTLFDQLDTAVSDGIQILGGKTGYTEQAGLCLASAAEKDGKEYLLVTMGAPGDHTTPPYHINDAIFIYQNIT